MLGRRDRYINRYIALCEIFKKISNNIKTYNVIELIKSKLEEGKEYSQSCSDLFELWKAGNFAIDHEFRVQNDGKDPDARKLLDIAINSKYLNVAEALVRAGADIKPKKNGFTYLHTAFFIPSPNLFKTLMERKITITSNEQACAILEGFTNFSLDQFSPNKENAERAESQIKCVKMLIDYILEKNPNIEMSDSVKNNKELAKYWNACEANNKRWVLVDSATPSTETQVVSVQKENKSSCSIQ
ncbi:MAG: ankyrin repeat domain-containing protein [Wolbachia endosymbiont of Nomada marshamella]|nr:ankyrin repeat domain-containing protein [Wolbachia endosymbiont of Nomada marshamella]